MNDSELAAFLKEAKTIAVVGLSGNPMRPSHGVAQYLQEQGYRIIPVNPQESQVLGEVSYPSLSDVPEAVDIVDIFRRPEFVPDVVGQAIAKNARFIWMQEGVVHEESAAQATAARIPVVMDRCLLKEHMRLRRARLLT
jgi:uncharacterized protein